MSLIPFEYGGQQVRVIDRDGEPWFVLTDLCKVLELSNPTMVAERVDGDALSSTEVIDSMGRTQSARIVAESGMYEVIFLSRKPEAAAFRRWITSEVLPSIRKTGSYGVPALTEDQIIAQALAITTKRVGALTATVEQQGARLRLVEPKAEAFDRWLSSNVNYSVDRIAKALCASGAKTGRNRLLDHMGTRKKDGGLEWIYRDARQQWAPYQAQIETGRLAVKLGSYENSNTGEQIPTSTIRITPKGAAKLATVYGVLPESVAAQLEGDPDVAA